MSGTIMQAALRGVSLQQVRYVSPVAFGAAEPPVTEVYKGLEREYGMLAPPVALHSPAPQTLVACWVMLRETMLAPGLVERSVKEAVAAAVSVANTCPFCITMHSATLHALAGGNDGAAIAEGRVAEATDPVVRAAADWARANATREGDHAASFPVEHGPEMVGVAVTLHYLNRMVNVFLGEMPLPPRAPARALGPVTRMLSRMARSAARRAEASGASLGLLPAAPLPDDLAWAAGRPAIADTFARASAAIEAAGRRSVPEPVRALVAEQLASWSGEPKGLSRSWVEDALSALPEADKASGRLALLTAFASYQVDEGVIADFRAGQPDDRALVELTAWASLAAARAVGGWMRVGGEARDARTRVDNAPLA
jgi:AhpD family alkylhydroperoxidase